MWRSHTAWGAIKTPSPGEEGIDTYIKRKQESFELLLLYKSGDDLLSHKAASERSEGSRFVGAGGDRSHVARTKFVPGGSPNRRRHKERRALTLIYKKTSLSVN